MRVPEEASPRLGDSARREPWGLRGDGEWHWADLTLAAIGKQFRIPNSTLTCKEALGRPQPLPANTGKALCPDPVLA